MVEAIFLISLFVTFVFLTPLLISNRRNIIAIILILIPLEVTKSIIPILQIVEMRPGEMESIFDLARLFMIYSFLLWFIMDLKSLVPFIKHRISYLIAVFIFVFLLSAIFISPETGRGINESIRYIIYFMFFAMSVQFLKEIEDYKFVFKVIVIVAVILSIEAIFEYSFGYTLWLDQGRRAMATYRDPNIFARFLDVVILMLLISRINKFYFIKPLMLDIALLLSGIALMFTVSRQGWLVLFVSLFFVTFFLEKKIRRKTLLIMLLIVIVSLPILYLLMETRQEGLEMHDIGARAGLLLGGLLMFFSNPLFGVGAGGFQSVMITEYLNLLPWGINSATMSHTYIMTILAELGIVGILVFFTLLIIVYKEFKKIFRSSNLTIKTISLIAFSAILVIFISSQAEGRFFEEPFLWFFLGIIVSLAKNQEILLTVIEKPISKR